MMSKGGRPKLHPRDRRDIVAKCYVSGRALELIDRAAYAHDMTRSDFLRACAIAAAIQEDRRQVETEGALVTLATLTTAADA